MDQLLVVQGNTGSRDESGPKHFVPLVSWAPTTVLMQTLAGWVKGMMIRWANRADEYHVR